MCGIVAAVAARNVVPILIEGLRRLEYRGYDSAGVAVINGNLERLRSTGRVANLAALAEQNGLHGAIGIAHTRWATHGAPSERNAHPHVSGGVCVVHNGIVENHEEMRQRLRVHLGHRYRGDRPSGPLVPAERRFPVRSGPGDDQGAARRLRHRGHGRP
jgi:glucosamine--fructose-6-phosphate aminotransferase (isomerizing)